MRRRRHRGSRGPPELRLAYGARARPLGRAILSLLPPPPPPDSACPSCRGAPFGCLACRRWAYLLRDGDPVAYRRLITRAVCAIQPSLAAPPPPRYTPGIAGHSQAKLVRETIKWILTDRSCATKSVLCNGCRKGGQAKCVSDLVSSSSWDILLHRIGDLLMCYILRHSSVFLPVKKNDYFQVTGVPLNVVLQGRIFTARNQQSKSTRAKCPTCYVWRNAEMVQHVSRGNGGNSSKFGFYSSDNTQKIDTLQSSGSCGPVRNIKPKCSSEGCNSSKFPCTNGSAKSNCYTQKPRKRKRLYSWQRCCKQKQMCSEGKINDTDFNVCNFLSDDSAAKVNDQTHHLEPTADSTSFGMNKDENSSQIEGPYNITVLSSEKSSSSVLDIRPSQGLSCGYGTSGLQFTSPQSGPICFSCLMLNASKCVSVHSLIARHAIFYNRRISDNVFHCSHLINKREGPDALSLIKHIFGIKGCCIKFLQWDCHGSTTTDSNCLCHWLLQLVKNLIRNSKRCQYKKLFLKHCSVKSKLTSTRRIKYDNTLS